MLEQYFAPFKAKIIGDNQTFDGPYGKQRILYTDWTASGRMYRDIEDKFIQQIFPFVANTHTETSVTGCAMTLAYHKAKNIIKAHVNANEENILISSNSGMTGVVNKFQRILGLKIHEKYSKFIDIKKEDKPIIFVTHMEHHSNQTSWIETIADVEVIPPDGECCFDIGNLQILLDKYKDRKVKIAAVTSCSNVTGIITPYHEIAKLMHQNGGLCFVDFACSAPYIDINMRPKDTDCHLDAIYFSPHKFLGGPGSSGILLFDQKLYKNKVPDNPGGGTVDWTNPWGEHKYMEHIESREDGGTPSFLQTIRVAFSIQLKEEMGVKNMLDREEEILEIIWPALDKIENLKVLADNCRHRLGVISFYIDGLHYNLAVKLLNDRFGIQMRGGCSCAGTYGHYLLEVSQKKSQALTKEISSGILNDKPGWVRMSIHPTITNEEIIFVTKALEALSKNHTEWAKDYVYNKHTNEFSHISNINYDKEVVKNWFKERANV